MKSIAASSGRSMGEIDVDGVRVVMAGGYMEYLEEQITYGPITEQLPHEALQKHAARVQAWYRQDRPEPGRHQSIRRVANQQI